jgi:hypothetical protein
MSRLAIAFLGQCHVRGYEGVPPDATFPEVCRNIVQASRPGHHVELIAETYQHPAHLHAAVTAALARRPRVVVIEVVGWLAIAGSSVLDLSRLPRGIRSAYQRGQHLRRVSRSIIRKTEGSALIHSVRTNALALASSLLQPLLPRLPRPTIAEYEACVSSALSLIASQGVTAVVQGPGAGNFAVSSKRLPDDAVERYRAVSEMARRVATEHGALYVDRWDTVAGGFFIPGTTRPTKRGHSTWGHLLADHLLRAGVV